jgi:hypothetical protein
MTNMAFALYAASAAARRHPALGFLGGGGAMLAEPFGVPFLMPSMASTLRVPVSGVMLSTPPREGAIDCAPRSTVA